VWRCCTKCTNLLLSILFPTNWLQGFYYTSRYCSISSVNTKFVEITHALLLFDDRYVNTKGKDHKTEHYFVCTGAYISLVIFQRKVYLAKWVEDKCRSMLFIVLFLHYSLRLSRKP
jgi:hypothetical protein